MGEAREAPPFDSLGIQPPVVGFSGIFCRSALRLRPSAELPAREATIREIVFIRSMRGSKFPHVERVSRPVYRRPGIAGTGLETRSTFPTASSAVGDEAPVGRKGLKVLSETSLTYT